MYFEDTAATLLAQDVVLQHDMWGKINPLPSTIFAKLQERGFEGRAAHTDIVCSLYAKTPRMHLSATREGSEPTLPSSRSLVPSAASMSHLMVNNSTRR